VGQKPKKVEKINISKTKADINFILKPTPTKSTAVSSMVTLLLATVAMETLWP
jgi:hypothetical protein